MDGSSHQKSTGHLPREREKRVRGKREEATFHHPNLSCFKVPLCLQDLCRLSTYSPPFRQEPRCDAEERRNGFYEWEVKGDDDDDGEDGGGAPFLSM